MSLMWVTEILSPNHLSILKSFEFVVLTLFSLAKDSISNNVGNVNANVATLRVPNIVQGHQGGKSTECTA